MNRRNSVDFVLIVTLLFVLITLLLFFTTLWGEEKTGITILSLIFVVFAEISVYLSYKFVDKSEFSDKRFLWSSFIPVSLMYFAATVCMALLKGFYYTDFQKYILHQFIVLCLAGGLLIVFYALALRTSRDDDEVYANFARMQDIENRLVELANCEKCSAYRERLEKICEAVHYSDRTLNGDIDEKISKETAVIENYAFNCGNEDCIAETISNLENLFNIRRIEALSHNRGRL